MEFKEMRDIDTAVDFISDDFELVGESILTEVYIAGVDGLTESFDFIKSALMLDLNKYFDDKLYSGVPKRVMYLSRNLDKLKDVSFLDIKDKKTIVTPGFEKSIYDKVKFLTTYMELNVANTISYIDNFQKDMAIFISDSDKRKSKHFNKDHYKNIVELQIKENKVLEDQIKNRDTGDTTIRALVGNMNGYSTSIENTAKIFKSGIDERDLKKHLKDVKDVRARLDAILELVETEEVSKEAINELISVNTIMANQYTLLGKSYYLLYEVSQILINIWEPITKK